MRVIVLWLAVSATPLIAQTGPGGLGPVPQPVPELPGAGRPVDLGAVQARRDRLMARIGAGVIAIPAALERDIEQEVLQDTDFRQDDYFFYLTGLETPGAWLVLAASSQPGGDSAYLFLPERDVSQERWTGLRLGPGTEAARLSGVGAVFPVERLDSVLATLPRRFPGPLYAPLHHATLENPRVRAWIGQGRDLRNVVPPLDSLRLVKDTDELTRLRRAIAITTTAHRAAMRAARAGMFEYQLEATIEYTFRNLGADRVGFPSIVGSGPNSTTLHYDANRRQMETGDLVVMDIGAEYGQYTADVTRTIPVSGRFTPRQRAVYDLVLASQQAAIDAVKPGVTIGELNRIARNYMRDHSGQVCGERNCAEYFVHGLSHWLGMRVHDVGDYGVRLEPGMVLTIEPGIYLPDERLGVRIEDDVLVTETGGENMSADAPRTAADIEAWMRGRDAAGTAQPRGT